MLYKKSRAVAQSGSALAWGVRGPGFDSRRPDFLNKKNARFIKRLKIVETPHFGVFFVCLKGGIAQLVRALASHARCRQFESDYSHFFKRSSRISGFSIFTPSPEISRFLSSPPNGMRENRQTASNQKTN